jgi:hypothetical protein
MMKPLRRPLLAAAASALIAGTVSFAAFSYAQSGSAIPSTVAPAPGGILVGVHKALEDLVTNGSITQAQADAVQHQASAGSIDPKALVEAGTLTDAQMRLVANAIDQVKQNDGR